MKQSTAELYAKSKWKWFRSDDSIMQLLGVSFAAWSAMSDEQKDDFRFWSFVWEEPQGQWLQKGQSQLGAARSHCSVIGSRLGKDCSSKDDVHLLNWYRQLFDGAKAIWSVHFKPTTPNLKYYLLDATPPRTELRKLAEPLMPKTTPDETGPPQTRSQTRAQLDPTETASGLLPIVKIMLQNLHTAGIDHLIARPTSLHGSSNTSVLLKCRRVNSLQQAAAAREETEREALLAEVLRQKEELKKIKLEPED